jgi:hypothetical protein
MLDAEVLVFELLTIDRFTACSLCDIFMLASLVEKYGYLETYVSAGKVTTLSHEPGNYTVERRACISEALLASCQGAEVTSGLWDDVVVEFEHDAAP